MGVSMERAELERACGGPYSEQRYLGWVGRAAIQHILHVSVQNAGRDCQPRSETQKTRHARGQQRVPAIQCIPGHFTQPLSLSRSLSPAFVSSCSCATIIVARTVQLFVGLHS
eukprot:gene11069-biopygen12375